MQRMKIEYSESEPVTSIFSSRFKSKYGVESLLPVAQPFERTNCPVGRSARAN